MRLQNAISNNSEILEFEDWILRLGDCKLGGTNNGEVSIDIPDDLLITN